MFVQMLSILAEQSAVSCRTPRSKYPITYAWHTRWATSHSRVVSIHGLFACSFSAMPSTGLIPFINFDRAPIDDFNRPLQSIPERSLHFDIAFCPLLHISPLVPFHKEIRRKSPDQGAVPAIDAPVTGFHRDSANHRFQRDRVFFSMPRSNRVISTHGEDIWIVFTRCIPGIICLILWKWRTFSIINFPRLEPEKQMALSVDSSKWLTTTLDETGDISQSTSVDYVDSGGLVYYLKIARIVFLDRMSLKWLTLTCLRVIVTVMC